MTDDLSAPLGLDKPSRAQRLAIRLPHLLIAFLSLPVLAFAGWTLATRNPMGGEPIAVAPAVLLPASADATPAPAPEPQPRTAAAALPATPPTDTDPLAGTVPPGSTRVTVIDGSSGKLQSMVVPLKDDDRAPPVPDGAPVKEPAGKVPSLDNRVSEPGRHGPLPKIAQDGARPADVFAQGFKPLPGKADAPRIAIVVGGLGIGASVTTDALRRLPEAVTVAFAPYGTDLERQVARARAAHHEVMLQVPMEPFDYPDNDPGPQTLLTSLDAGQNIDRLHWLMSRFQGYVGVINTMGARLAASEQALSPVLREVAKRGLIYLDDGSSPRSLASQIAGASNLPFARADLAIDALASAADIDRALGRLEQIARERGSAVGVSGALPVNIERISKWAKAAEGRGIMLVPITAVVARAKSS